MIRDRPRRQIRAPARYAQPDTVSFTFYVIEEMENANPLNFKEAVTCKEKQKWIKAMNEEMESLLKNETWILVDRPH